MMSRMSTPWAREGPLPAKNASAATSRAKARVILPPFFEEIGSAKFGSAKIGHNGQGFASHAGVSVEISKSAVKKALLYRV
jgi:hypothetical protein